MIDSDLRRVADESSYHSVTCPNCGSNDAVHRYQLRISAIVTCRVCELHYVNPRVSSAEIERKLQLWASEDVVDSERLKMMFEPATVSYFARLLGFVTRYASDGPRRLIDIGCGTGGFLKVARDRGWKVEGIEAGRASANFARDELHLAIHHGTLYDYSIPAIKFDAVSLLEVIEHLEHPRRALDLARELLKPHGLLLVTTPNFDSLYRRLYGARWWVINCEDEHIVLFSRSVLTRMLQEAGFEVLECRFRGIDWLGLWRELKRHFIQAPATEAVTDALGSYYASRSAKSKIKHWLGRLGILHAARLMLRALDRSFGWRVSPTYAWGETLIIVARRTT